MSILVWFRNDLRLHDHEPLQAALKAGGGVIPVYCFDPRQFGETAFGFPKTGKFRAQFLLESVADLRRSLQQRGSDLIIRWGEPETVIPSLVKELDAQAVYWHEEATAEELAVENALADKLEAMGTTVQTYWGATLYHLDDLPFSINKVPEVFTQFRKQVEKSSIVYEPFSAPKKLPPLPQSASVGELPDLAKLGVEAPQSDDRAVLKFVGGETAGLARLQAYIWDADCLKVYKQTRNGMLGANYSSKFSAWLALGCLSPRWVYQAVQDYENERVRNDSTYWLVFELLWRDYFRLICLKHGDRVFYPSGLRGLKVDWQQDWPRFNAWCAGETGYPLVDANMRELAATGFMSNRGRQNVASFLTKNLGIDWRMGAEWFESLLVDYDVCSNWGNWNYTAGVGNDARGFRYFNIPKQAKDYDPQGDYVKHWLPALQRLPASKVHAPWQLSNVEQKRFEVRLGVDYPNPIVDLHKSVQANERIYNAALERSA
ncbi:DASH family cryptochrome [Leptolyngbya iicbica]|uniref:Cryptochrome DASH n=2 Tax=Cyanophyceae TaxID=3028117 RepID=A0A4Q7E1D1_9CYAN|nr:DASH family cryptochrome [Leptolyngbya sp. LK]RZM75250.1 DASH family cryptochrome [Leptolyngbya sp. LK]